MKEVIIGWDVGGANIKAVRIQKDSESDGQLKFAAAQRAFSLWREPHKLSAVLADLGGSLENIKLMRDMAVTMTAELADCFSSKRDGVVFVLDAFRTAFPEIELQVYGIDGRFRSVEEARDEPLKVAAANWMASATLVARQFPDVIFLDVGSTTADVIPIVEGCVAAQGRTDTERLAKGELIYTGALRTPVCAIVRSVSFGGRRCRVAAEHFAIAADAYLWLEEIKESDYTCETPDGKGRSQPEAGARLARMVCADLEMLGRDEITAIAWEVSRAQARQIADGIRQVMRRIRPAVISTAVLTGEGDFLARAAAEQAGLTICSLAQKRESTAARTSPAAAVACLLAELVDAR